MKPLLIFVPPLIGSWAVLWAHRYLWRFPAFSMGVVNPIKNPVEEGVNHRVPNS
jgi:hypothetical protein